MQQSETVESEGMSYYQDDQTENALKIRLEVTPIYERIEMYLSGQEYTINPETNSIIKAVTSKPKANAIGVRAIMNVITSYINNQVVQGNLKDQDIKMLMQDYRQKMGSLLAWRADYYDIKRSERQQIIDFLEPLIFMFISRTKDNKERDSYGMRVVEKGKDTVINQSKNWFKS